MRQCVSVFLFLLCVMTGYSRTVTEEDEIKALSPADKELLTKIVRLEDEGLYEAVSPDFDYLAKKYPKNYVVNYERMYNLYMLKKYGEIIKDRKLLLNHKCASERAFQLMGNAYDMSGDSKKAAKIYEDGLKRFPNSGSLYLELGNLALFDNDYGKALENYSKGIVVQPGFASNYFWAAKIYLASQDAKVWGLVYAESEVLLAPSDESRRKEMAGLMVDCMKESIKVDGDTLQSVSLVTATGIDPVSMTARVTFPLVYETTLMLPLMRFSRDKTPIRWTLGQLTEIRKGIVEAYFSEFADYYGDSMYLLEYQKKIIDAGHWDAYNCFLFMDSFPDESEEWYSSNSEAMDSFIKWYNAAPFRLGDGRTVDPFQIKNPSRTVDLKEWFQLQARLVSGGLGASVGEE